MKYDPTLTLTYGDMLVLRHCVKKAIKLEKSATNREVLEELYLKITLALDK